MDSNIEPKLAPPGAGLPAIELFLGRLIFTLNRWTTTRERSNARFQQQRQAIRALLLSCDAEAGARRILIARPAGLEDSSRYWSVWMTLDHLRIVNEAVARAIRSLSNDFMPEGTASTAAVKPNPDATRAIIADYEQSCDALLATVAEAPTLNTRLRYAHPGFGPLNAAGRHTLAGGHLSIHRVQVERILDGIAATRRGLAPSMQDR